MAHPGKVSTLRLTLSPEERQDLFTIHNDPQTTALLVRRVRLMLLLAATDPLPIDTIARQVGIARRHVYKWVQRYRDQGLEGLRDRRSWPATQHHA